MHCEWPRSLSCLSVRTSCRGVEPTWPKFKRIVPHELVGLTLSYHTPWSYCPFVKISKSYRLRIRPCKKIFSNFRGFNPCWAQLSKNVRCKRCVMRGILLGHSAMWMFGNESQWLTFFFSTERIFGVYKFECLAPAATYNGTQFEEARFAISGSHF